MRDVEELLTVLLDSAWADACRNQENESGVVTTGLQVLLQQYRLSYRFRDHDLIWAHWKLVNQEGRRTGLFKGLDLAPDCKNEFRRFLKNEVH